MKKSNNKGFSLVELIVVVAIMAVLVGVLAPAYLRYVEKSRFQKDCSAVAELEEAIKITLSEETVSQNVVAGTSYKITLGAKTTTEITTTSCTAPAAFVNELVKTIPSVKFTSNTITGNVEITFTMATTGAVTVTNNLASFS